MNSQDLAKYKTLLLGLRARLKGDVDAMASAALHEASGSAMPIHMAELGSEAFEQEFTLSVMETEEGTLTAIDEALERVNAGTYGICTDCGKAIPKTRLNVLPHSPYCVQCAELRENG